MTVNQERLRLSWIISNKEDIDNLVVNKKGFDILIRNEMPIFHSNI